MKIIALLVLASLALVSAGPLQEHEYQALFSRFISRHGRVYADSDEFFGRYNVFRNNLDHIVQHQMNEARTFDMTMNHFGDLTVEEFAAQNNHFKPLPRSNKQVTLDAVDLPSSVDWAAKGVLTPPKNQGQCGSCWSFSTTGAIEGAHAIATGNLVSLSEQELVDCASSAGNAGCNGGSMPAAFGWVQQNGGLCTEEAYPYTATNGTCQMSSCTSATTISGYQEVTSNDCSSLQAAVAQQPVSIAVDAANSGWQFYSSGVLQGTCGTQLDHGVLNAGYGTDSSGQDYWIVKNSWGASWGQEGYIWIARDSSQGPGECGICMSPSYPEA